MTVAYATADDLTDYLEADVNVDGDVDRVLVRASELVDSFVRLSYDVDDDGIPTDTDLAVALKNATCAQVEYWAEVGEEADVESLNGRQVSLTGLSIDRLPPRLGNRAKAFLLNAGLTTIGERQQVWPIP